MTRDEPKHDRDWIVGCIKHDGFIKTDREDKANQIILEALQAEQVVRCKDCEHYNSEANVSYIAYCPMEDGEHLKPTDYCSFGKRRET